MERILRILDRKYQITLEDNSVLNVVDTELELVLNKCVGERKIVSIIINELLETDGSEGDCPSNPLYGDMR